MVSPLESKVHSARGPEAGGIVHKAAVSHTPSETTDQWGNWAARAFIDGGGTLAPGAIINSSSLPAAGSPVRAPIHLLLPLSPLPPCPTPLFNNVASISLPGVLARLLSSLVLAISCNHIQWQVTPAEQTVSLTGAWH